MSNFVETFKAGKEGKNVGLPMGIAALDKATNGIQKVYSYGLAASPKTGKTMLADYSFLLSPYLYCLEHKKLDNVEWIYLSGEIDRVSKEFRFAAFFMYYDYKIASIKHKDVTYPMSQDYLMGKLMHYFPNKKDFEYVPLQADHEEKLKEIYLKRIVPIFGHYNSNGIKEGTGKIIDFIEELENPTGIRNYLMRYAENNGTFNREPYFITEEGKKVQKFRIVSYTPKNPDKFVIIIVDHVRKLRHERGFNKKDNIDKWLEYTTWFRNICGWTFVNICHANRNVANIDRLRYAGEFIFPTADDVKDTGNLAEESTMLITMFNPNDEKYNLTKHFGVELANYPNYRSIHIAESRYTSCPLHIQTNMIGGINVFTPLNF